MKLSVVTETADSITLGWVPPLGVGGYVTYANGIVANVASAKLKTGTPRSSMKFSKTSPGPPFEIVATSRIADGIFTLDVGKYPSVEAPLYPSTALYPSETI